MNDFEPTQAVMTQNENLLVLLRKNTVHASEPAGNQVAQLENVWRLSCMALKKKKSKTCMTSMLLDMCSVKVSHAADHKESALKTVVNYMA